MDDFDLLDHYSVLGVDRDATPGEIDRAYREALLREHPDRSNHPHANERASRVNEAGRVLLDPNRRRQYDPEADTRERSARAGLRHLPVAAAEDNGSSQGRSDPRSRAGTDADEERYAQVAHNPRQQRGIDKPAARSSRVWRTFIAGTAAIAALIVTAALIYQFILRAETADFGQPGRANNEATVSAVANDQPAPSPADQSAKTPNQTWTVSTRGRQDRRLSRTQQASPDRLVSRAVQTRPIHRSLTARQHLARMKAM